MEISGEARALNEELFGFIGKSPNPYFAVRNVEEMLEADGYEKLDEGDSWELLPGGRYYVIRGGSSLIAFPIPVSEPEGFRIIATHGDSPAFKLKPLHTMNEYGLYARLNVEKYGGMILYSWLDRPLSVAGRVMVRNGSGGIREELVNADRDLCIIPSLAIHMDRKINEGIELNAQNDMAPLLAVIENSEIPDLYSVLKTVDGRNISRDEVLGSDLFLYNRAVGTFIGMDGELIAAPRLDDLQCAFAALKGFISSVKDGADNKAGHAPMYCMFNNEEVGSMTRQGAGSSFLRDVLIRITDSLEKDEAWMCRMMAKSMMVSADNAHALHPAHPEKADPLARPVPGKGIVIKYNAAQKYTTDAYSEAEVKLICEKAWVPWQVYANRSDIAGGSTLGSIASSALGMDAVDIGLAQLSMHSAMETAGAADTLYMAKMTEALFL